MNNIRYDTNDEHETFDMDNMIEEKKSTFDNGVDEL